MQAEMYHRLLIRWVARLKVERNNTLGTTIGKFIVDKRNNSITLDSKFNYDYELNVNHSKDEKVWSKCPCTLCKITSKYVSIRRAYHRFRKSYYNDLSIFFSEIYAKQKIPNQTETGFFEQEETIYLNLINEYRKKRRSLVVEIKNLQKPLIV